MREDNQVSECQASGNFPCISPLLFLFSQLCHWEGKETEARGGYVASLIRVTKLVTVTQTSELRLFYHSHTANLAINFPGGLSK